LDSADISHKAYKANEVGQEKKTHRYAVYEQDGGIHAAKKVNLIHGMCKQQFFKQSFNRNLFIPIALQYLNAN
jgi:hypothetical protein